MSLLKDLYNGDQQPFGEFNMKSNEFSKAVGKSSRAETRLLEQFPEITELFEEYMTLHVQVSEICTYQAFETGFRAGAQLMLEMLKPLN